MPRTDEANQEIREQRRSLILHTAAKVVAQQGYGNTKIADIAAACEMSQGLIYRYFSSKEEVFGILVNLVIDAAAQLIQALPTALPSTESTGYQKMYWLSGQLLPNYYQNPDFPMLITHGLANQAVPPKIRENIINHVTRFQNAVRNVIIQGQNDGTIAQTDPDQLTMLYLSTLQGLALGVLYLDTPPEKYPTVESLMKIFEE
jgi:AcrR family transcriptional regulator